MLKFPCLTSKEKNKQKNQVDVEMNDNLRVSNLYQILKVAKDQ